MAKRLHSILLVSNGSGEDRIGAECARVWRRLDPRIQIQALPLVGSGLFYQQAGVPLLKAGFEPPSQGFAYLKPALLVKDLQAGLLPHLRESLTLARRHPCDHILAIGDIVPMLVAAYAQKPFAFVGCALSDYYLGENSRRSTYDPLQIQILKHQQALCFARDTLTSANLKRRGVRAQFVGSLMLDCFDHWTESELPDPLLSSSERYRMLILPGSHADAVANFKFILQQLQDALSMPIDWWVLKAPQLALTDLHAVMRDWQSNGSCWQFQNSRLGFVDSCHFKACLEQVDAVLGFAGTANEQAVAMGLPVISFAIPGAQQYTWAFGEAQQRLLGAGLSFLGDAHPRLLAYQLQRVLFNPEYRQAAEAIAQQRFGESGGIERMIRLICAAVAD